LRKLRRFTLRFCKKNFKPLAPDVDCSFEAWLEKTNYSGERKAQLRKVREEVVDLRYQKKFWKCKSFMKDETYGEYKAARLINSRHDAFKTVFGPIIKLIEEEVYKYPSFVKHIPVADYPRYLSEMLEADGSVYASTDFTAMECHFKKVMMETMEFVLYKYMTRNLPGFREFMVCLAIKAGINVCLFKYFIVKCIARRMSGEMDTSLGNGFANLMIIKFTWWRLNRSDPPCAVEGDDGLIKCDPSLVPTEEWFKALGFTIKMEINSLFQLASFCGMVFDKSEMINITSPAKVILNFPWLRSVYLNAKQSKKLQLLRAKALSYAYQYPGCPMVDALAHACMRATSNITVSRKLVTHGLDTYQKAKVEAALDGAWKLKRRFCGAETRLLMEKKHGLPVDIQLTFERICDNINSLVDLDCLVLLEPYVHRDTISYYDSYVRAGLEDNVFSFGERPRNFHVGGLNRNAKASKPLVAEKSGFDLPLAAAAP